MYTIDKIERDILFIVKQEMYLFIVFFEGLVLMKNIIKSTVVQVFC